MDGNLEPRPAARAIVIKDGKLLIMKRSKNGLQYYSLVGGRLEEGELPEQTVLREVTEETGVVVKDPKLVFIEAATSNWGVQYIFLCEWVSGEPSLDENSEEYDQHILGINTYEPIWMDLELLDSPELAFKSEAIREELLSCIKNGFPETPKTLK